MTAAHIEKLRTYPRCPCCGAQRAESDCSADATHARAAYICGGIWITSNDQITVDTPCPAGSHLASRLWNIELQGHPRHED